MIFASLLQIASTLPTDVSALESSISALERSISALESEIKTLESSSVPWEHSVLWFSSVVLLGVAMEFWVIRHEWRDDMESWAIAFFLGIARLPGKPSARKVVAEIASVSLISLGIAGELGAGMEVASINGSLRVKGALLRGKGAELRSKSDQLLALVRQQVGDAEERTANLELDVLKLQQQLAAQGSRSALLFGKKREGFVSWLRPFGGQKIEVRHCRLSFNQFSIDTDTMQLVMRLQYVLETDAKWVVTPYIEENCNGTGIEVSVSPEAPESTRMAADALWMALNGLPLTMLGNKPFVMESPRPPQPQMYDCGTKSKCENKEVVLPPLGADTIVLTVLSHP